MGFHDSDYFKYKKNKITKMANRAEAKKPISKLNFIFQLFVATFIVMFLFIVFIIINYSSKINLNDIKNSANSYGSSEYVNSASTTFSDIPDDEQRTIDKRLIQIQQEENAPSEAKIVDKNIKKEQIIDLKHIEEVKKIEKSVAKKDKLPFTDTNVEIMSKVLIGKFKTFDEAKTMQNKIKQQNSTITPFVRKVGNVFCVQVGSFGDFEVAKNYAKNFKNNGYEVWIYQQ